MRKRCLTHGLVRGRLVRLPGALACGLVALSAAGALAAETVLTPSIALTARFDDNTAFSPDNKNSDWLLQASPELLYRRSTDTFKTELSAGGDLQRYLKDETYGNLQRYRGRVEGQPWESLGWYAAADYRKDSNLESTLEEAKVVTDRSDVRSFGPEAGFSFAFSEPMRVDGRYAHRQTLYQDESSIDYVYDQVSLTWQWRHNEEGSAWALRPDYYRAHSEVSTFQSYSLSVGWLPALSETTTLSAFVGGVWGLTNYSDSSRRYSSDDKDTSRALQLDVSLVRKVERGSLTAGLHTGMQYGTEGEAIRVQHVFASYSRLLSERLSTIVSASYTHTSSDASSSDGNENHSYFEVSPRVVWRLSEDHSLTLAYSYAQSRAQDEDRPARRNRVWVTANFNFPQTW